MSMHRRITRTVAAVALFGASMILAGTALVANAVPASADAGGTDVCSSHVSTFDFFTGVVTGTLSGCHQQGSGTTEALVDPNHPNGPTAATIHWATGNATTHVIITSVPDSSVPCPAGFAFGTDTYITAVDGPYAGSNGFEATCTDITGFPILHTTNVGPVVI
jgi:hypothetical protein